MTKRKSEVDVVYLLQMEDGSQKKVTVPGDWKVTFGPLTPGQKGEPSHGAKALRFWTGKDRQRAVFTGVASFRDMSIPVEEKITKTQAETYYKGEGDNRKAVNVEVAASEWVNPDEPRANQQPVQRLIPDGVAELNLDTFHGVKRAKR